MQYQYKFFLVLVASSMLALFSACGGDSSHEAADNFVPPDKSIQSIAKLAEAAPDECWKQYSGDEGNFPPAPSVPVNGSCAAGQPKTNESYIWGMTKTDDRLWFGTAANVECLVIGTYLDYASNPIIFDTRTKTSLNDVFSTPTTPYVQVCEFGRSWVKAASAELPAALGDWRPPTIFSYRDGEGLVARTAQVTGPNNDTQRLRSTLGLRSAGNKDGIAFLAGPNIPGDKIFIFAFRQSDGEYLGSHELLGYSNIRKWKVLYGDLYTAVTLSNARADELYQAGGSYKHGRILKWVGTAASPFQGPGGKAPFVEVGELNGGGSELSEYGSNRIAVSTWPGGVDGSGSLNLRKIKPAGISISVPVPAGGLSPTTSASNFNEVFTFADYDPDLARAFTYGGGALAYFDGWLVWGSMHVPFTNVLALSNTYSYRGLVSSNTQCRDILDPGYAADRQDSDSTAMSTCGEVSGSSNRTTCINNIYSDPATDYGVKASYDACLLQLQSEYCRITEKPPRTWPRRSSAVATSKRLPHRLMCSTVTRPSRCSIPTASSIWMPSKRPQPARGGLGKREITASVGPCSVRRVSVATTRRPATRQPAPLLAAAWATRRTITRGKWASSAGDCTSARWIRLPRWIH